MAHPHHKDHIANEERRIDRLDLPDAGAASGVGRLQKMKLHEDEGGNPPGEPTGSSDDEQAEEAAEGEQE